MNIKEIYQLFLASSGICTDTRKLQENELFFALKGDHFNGNEYAKKALENGATYAIIDEEKFKTDKTIIVNDVLETLQELASFHRDSLSIPIIAITGSNGKTTTKELISEVLNSSYNTFATQGNFNNHIGVPLSLLSITKKHEMAIIEMGANHQGEIAAYCKWAKPDFGLITNIGKAHLEGFGGIQGVIKGKTELYRAIEEHNGKIFYNLDDAILKEKSTMVSKTISYGQHPDADYTYKVIPSSDFVTVKAQNTIIKTNLIGQYNATNIAAVIALGSYFNVPIEKIKNALESYQSQNNRSELLKYKGNTIVLDAYNANPTSMQAALNSFNAIENPNKVVLLGDMFEVGETTAEEHQKVIDQVLSYKFKQAVFVGKFFYNQKSEKAVFFKTTEEAKNWLAQQNFTNYHLLIKGSRGMKMETLIR